jgi:methylase of polypeptide subunit release factors
MRVERLTMRSRISIVTPRLARIGPVVAAADLAAVVAGPAAVAVVAAVVVGAAVRRAAETGAAADINHGSGRISNGFENRFPNCQIIVTDPSKSVLIRG